MKKVLSIISIISLLVGIIFIPTGVTVLANTEEKSFSDDFSRFSDQIALSDDWEIYPNANYVTIDSENNKAEIKAMGNGMSANPRRVQYPLSAASINQSVSVTISAADIEIGKWPALWLRVQNADSNTPVGYVFHRNTSHITVQAYTSDGAVKEINKIANQSTWSLYDTFTYTFSAESDTNGNTVLKLMTTPVVTDISTNNGIVPRDVIVLGTDSTPELQKAGTVAVSCFEGTTETDPIMTLSNIKYNRNIGLDSKWETYPDSSYFNKADSKINIKVATTLANARRIQRPMSEAGLNQTASLTIDAEDMVLHNKVEPVSWPVLWLRVQNTDANSTPIGYYCYADSSRFYIAKSTSSGTEILTPLSSTGGEAWYRISDATKYYSFTYNFSAVSNGDGSTTLTFEIVGDVINGVDNIKKITVTDSTEELQTAGTVAVSGHESSSRGNDFYIAYRDFNYTADDEISIKDFTVSTVEIGNDWVMYPNSDSFALANNQLQFTVPNTNADADMIHNLRIQRPMVEAAVNQNAALKTDATYFSTMTPSILFLRVQNDEANSVPIGYYCYFLNKTMYIGKSTSEGYENLTSLAFNIDIAKYKSLIYDFTAVGNANGTTTLTLKMIGNILESSGGGVNRSDALTYTDSTAELQSAGTVAVSGYSSKFPYTSYPLQVDDFTYNYGFTIETEEPDDPSVEYTEYEEYINYRHPLSNTYNKLTTGDKELNVVYFGGSVTAGTGASDKESTSWRALIGEWLIRNFPEAKINNINRAAGESGTYLGSFRVERDVIAEKPDLLFLEYSINDYYAHTSYEQAALQYETIVRKVREALPECDIVTVLVTESAHAYRLISDDELHEQAQAHEDMAVKYNIPTIRVGHALADTLPENWTFNEDWLAVMDDRVHPNDAGYKIYYNVIKEFMHNSLLYYTNDGNITNHEMPDLQSEHLLDGNITVIQPTAELLARSEELGGSGFTYNSGLYGLHNYYGSFMANSEGAELVIEFKGTELVSHLSITNSAAQFYVKVDNGEYELKNFASLNPTTIVKDIPSGEHTVYFKPVFSSDLTSIWIGAFYSLDSSMQTAKHDGVTNILDFIRLKKYMAGEDVMVGSYLDYDENKEISTGDLVALVKTLLGVENTSGGETEEPDVPDVPIEPDEPDEPVDEAYEDSASDPWDTLSNTIDSSDIFSSFRIGNMTETENSVYSEVYTNESDNTVVRYLSLEAEEMGDEVAYITMMADSHISNAFRPENAQYVANGLKYADSADMVVMLGDNIDSSTMTENVDTLKKVVWDEYPNNICVLGNHELTYATDKAAQREVLEEVWPHNTIYCKKVVKNNLYLIGMDNAAEAFCFTEEQCDLLAADIAEARQNKAAIILLQHVAPSALDNTLGANARMAELLANNGDVIKAVFAGHNHMDALDYVDSSYEADNGTVTQVKIPCYRLMSSKYDESKNNYGAHVLVLAVHS